MPSWPTPTPRMSPSWSLEIPSGGPTIAQGNVSCILAQQAHHTVIFCYSRSATTHADLLLRAIDLKIPYTVIHNASIMNAAGACGLALYNFGQTISIPFFTDSWRPSSWLDRIDENIKIGLHTLALLDIKVKEQSEENMTR